MASNPLKRIRRIVGVVTDLTVAATCTAKTLSAQVGPLQPDEIAIYGVLLRHPEFSGRGPSFAPVVLLREVRGHSGLFSARQRCSMTGSR
jgi:hypothetical protein